MIQYFHIIPKGPAGKLVNTGCDTIWFHNIIKLNGIGILQKQRLVQHDSKIFIKVIKKTQKPNKTVLLHRPD